MDLMNDSILLTIKKMLGLEENYTPFDVDVIIHINSALMILNQLGIGPKGGFEISDASSKWSDFLTNSVNLGSVKNYVYLSVKMLFDPPTNSFVLDAMKRQVEELGWRLNVQAESAETFDFVVDDNTARTRGWPGNENIEARAQEYEDSKG